MLDHLGVQLDVMGHVLEHVACGQFGAGSDYMPGDLPSHEDWADGVYDAVNQPQRVHGFYVNFSDTLSYKGSNAELQKMTQKLANAKGTPTGIVLHAGKGIAKSPWSKKPVDTADWSVTLAGNRITIDIWLGGSVTLDQLDLPKAVEIKSGGEIETFIKRHNETP